MKTTRNILSFIISALVSTCLFSCGGNNEFYMSGKLSNNDTKQLFVVFDDPIADIDTISVNSKGEFSYTFVPDTITMLRLVNDSGIALPVFADKGWEVSIEGSLNTPKVKGNGPNKDLQDFRNEIAAILNTGNTSSDSTSASSISDIAEKFIKSHRQSYASAYILNDYFIQSDNPDKEKIKALIEQLDGHVKDCRVVDVIQKNLAEKNNMSKSDYINYFSCKRRNGEYISWSSKDELFTLINIWAGWSKESIVKRDSLFSILGKLPKDNFRILNISIDYEKKLWEKNCKKDTLQWIEVCDFKGWKNQITEQCDIRYIPYNILVDKNRKIIATNIYGDELVDKMKELTDKKK